MSRLLLVSMLIAVTTLLSAQSSQSPDYTLRVQVELVQLPVSVIDEKGHPVRGLPQHYFKIYEDRVQQDISFFKQEDVPVSIGLVIDASSSMFDKQDRTNAAALTFVRESNPEDETFVVSFGDQPHLEQDFTRSIRRLNRSLNRIAPRGNTALFDAVQFAARHLERGTHEKKVLVVVSDGEDNKSRLKLRDVLEEIRESKIILYSVGLLSSEAALINNGPFKGKAKKALQDFSEVTGGRAFFPKSLNDVDEVCRTIAHDIRNQYAIGYRPSNDKMDGTWRTVNVQVQIPKGKPKVRVHTKKGYYSPNGARPATELTPTAKK